LILSEQDPGRKLHRFYESKFSDLRSVHMLCALTGVLGTRVLGSVVTQRYAGEYTPSVDRASHVKTFLHCSSKLLMKQWPKRNR